MYALGWSASVGRSGSLSSAVTALSRDCLMRAVPLAMPAFEHLNHKLVGRLEPLLWVE
jgi:hypothetical protein